MTFEQFKKSICDKDPQVKWALDLIDEEVKEALQHQREEIEKKQRAVFIADLYKCRSLLGKPLSYREGQDPQEIMRYNWLNVIIANLTDKYNVKHQDISEALAIINSPQNGESKK